MTDGPYELPPGWRWVRLGEVFEIQQGASMSPKRRVGRNPRPFLRTRNVLWGTVDLSSVDKMDFTDEEVEKLRLQPGDLLVCEGGDVGRTALWEGQLPLALYQNHIHRLRAKDTPVEPRFFMYWMQAAYQVFLAYQGAESRTAIPNLSGRRLKQFLAPFPPLSEQRRIVARIEELMARVREAQRLRQEAREDADRLWQATLAEMFPKPGAELPPGWRWVRLGEVTAVRYGKANPKKSGAVPIIGSGGKYATTAEPLITFPSVIIGRKGSAGEPFLALEPCWPSDTTFYLEWLTEIEPAWVFFWLSLNKISSEGASATLPSVRREDVEVHLIPLPPLAEQRRIVAHLEAVRERVQALKKAQEDTEAHLKELERSILDRAFRGEL